MTKTRGAATITKWVNSLNAEQMSRIYEMIDGPIPAEINSMSDDELVAALQDKG